GALIAWVVGGRTIGKADPRFLIFIVFLLTALSLYQMSGFNLDVTKTEMIISGGLQGLGMGILFPPLNTLTFATLNPHYRTEAAAVFSLTRSIGSSIGISLVVTLLAQNTQLNHAELVQHITPFSHAIQNLPIGAGAAWNVGAAGGIGMLNGEVTRQASMIAYVDNFKLMAYVTLAAVPFLLLL